MYCTWESIVTDDDDDDDDGQRTTDDGRHTLNLSYYLTHKMIGNFVQFEELIIIVIAGWGGSGGGDGGGGGRGRGRKSRCGHERVKNCNRTVNGGGKKTLFPIAIATAATISAGAGENGRVGR